MSERKALLDTKAAAEWLGIAPSTLGTWRVRGGAPKHVKLGRRVLFAPEDLESFVNAAKREHTSDAGPKAAA